MLRAGDWLEPQAVVRGGRWSTDLVTATSTAVAVAGPREWRSVVRLVPELAGLCTPVPTVELREAPRPEPEVRRTITRRRLVHT